MTPRGGAHSPPLVSWTKQVVREELVLEEVQGRTCSTDLATFLEGVTEALAETHI